MKDLKIHIIGAATAALLLSGCGSSPTSFFMGGQVSDQAVEQRTQLQQEAGDEAEDRAEGADEPITGDALEKASAAALEYLGEGRVTDTEVGDEEGYYEVEVTLDNGNEVDVHLDENFNVLGQEAEGNEVDDADEVSESEAGDEAEDSAEGPDVAITGDALEKASAAALEYVGEGRVTDSEVGDEEGYYEIEITLDNGNEVDVHLDENFNVLGQEAEGNEVDD